MQFITGLLTLAAVASAIPSPDRGGWDPQVTRGTPLIVGDGNPHQKYKYKQITNPGSCGDGPCENAYSDVKTYGMSWSVGGSGDGWISAGFEVSKETSTGEMHNCQSRPDEESNTVCVFWRQAYTLYTVQYHEHTGHDVKQSDPTVGDPYVIWAPNTDKGNGYVCARDDRCGSIGDEFWGEAEDLPSGGPQKYMHDDDWQ